MKRWVLIAPFSLALAACNCGEDAGLGMLVPKLEVQPDAVAFGDVPIGAVKRVRVTVRNIGTADLSVASADAMAPFAATLADKIVRTGSETSIDIAFSPVNTDPQSGTLLIASNDPARSMITVPLSGTGVQGFVTVRPTMVDFQNTTVGTTRSAEIFFSNLGLEAADGHLVTEGFIRPEHFTLTGLANFRDGAPLGIPPRSDVELVLEYRPIELGDDGGRIVLELCGDRCGLEIGVLASAAQAVIRVDPPVVDFGTVGIGSTAMQAVVVQNSGQTPVQVTAISTAGGAELSASAARGLPATVDGNSSMAINLEFTPSSSAQFEGELIVDTNDHVVPEAHVRVTGSGEGPLFVVQPPAISFGLQRQAATYERTLLLLNAGSADVRVQGISVSGGSFGLTQVPGLPSRLGSGESLTARVTFAPHAVAEYTGEVTITTDDPGHATVTVPLTGGMTDQLCELDMSSGRINFGLMPVGYSRDKSVEVRNIGMDTCVLMSGAFRAPVDPAITTVMGSFPMFPVTLMPGQATVLDFNYTPTAMVESKANYVLTTGDPVYPERHLALLGSAAGYVDLFTQPDHVDFGLIRPGCGSGERPVTIFNAGTVDAVIDSVEMTPGTTPEIVLNSILVPFTLRAGSSQPFHVAYSPADLGPDSSVVEVSIHELPYPLVVPLSGEGTTNPRAHDQFAQERNNAVDVLFVVDNSCSMADDQMGLAQNARRFIEQADITHADFRLGLTTTTVFPNPGELVGPVITSQTQGIESTFQLQANVGTFGSGIEQGLDAMAGALQLASTGFLPNANLRRPDALLVVIIISDEDDQSTAAPVFYLNVLRNAAPMGFIAAVVSGQATGCGPPPSAMMPGAGAVPAPRYEEFLMLTQGLSESICGDWATTLTHLGAAAFGLRTVFPLSKEADTSQPIDVRINGVTAPATSWMYDAADHSIRFTMPPPDHATITVDYTPAC